MTDNPDKLKRPDFNLEAILGLVGLLLGFLFIVVIYILENPQEVLTTWGIPLVIFLALCYGVGLAIIGYIISFEVNFHLANKMLELKPVRFLPEKFEEFRTNTIKALRRSVQMLTYFIFSFGLFLANLAGFSLAKIFIHFFIGLENILESLFGLVVVFIIRFLIMFFFQLILIIPFARLSTLWVSYRTIDDLDNLKEGEKN